MICNISIWFAINNPVLCKLILNLIASTWRANSVTHSDRVNMKVLANKGAFQLRTWWEGGRQHFHILTVSPFLQVRLQSKQGSIYTISD
jgi:hypothetical protein